MSNREMRARQALATARVNLDIALARGADEQVLRQYRKAWNDAVRETEYARRDAIRAKVFGRTTGPEVD